MVGAQAVHLQTPDIELRDATWISAAKTFDGDLCIDPRELQSAPLLETLLLSCGFDLRRNPGAWVTREGKIAVDLLVPEALAGEGKRGARLGDHGKRADRRAVGLEGALIDYDTLLLPDLRPDHPALRVEVAGPAALIVAKMHKLSDRLHDGERILAKDALDICRLPIGPDVEALTERFERLLKSELAREVTVTALEELHSEFARPDARGMLLLRTASRQHRGKEGGLHRVVPIGRPPRPRSSRLSA